MFCFAEGGTEAQDGKGADHPLRVLGRGGEWTNGGSLAGHGWATMRCELSLSPLLGSSGLPCLPVCPPSKPISFAPLGSELSDGEASTAMSPGALNL